MKKNFASLRKRLVRKPRLFSMINATHGARLVQKTLVRAPGHGGKTLHLSETGSSGRLGFWTNSGCRVIHLRVVKVHVCCLVYYTPSSLKSQKMVPQKAIINGQNQWNSLTPSQRSEKVENVSLRWGWGICPLIIAFWGNRFFFLFFVIRSLFGKCGSKKWLLSGFLWSENRFFCWTSASDSDVGHMMVMASNYRRKIGVSELRSSWRSVSWVHDRCHLECSPGRPMARFFGRRLCKTWWVHLRPKLGCGWRFGGLLECCLVQNSRLMSRLSWLGSPVSVSVVVWWCWI